jgi:DNA-binding transcriptional regulator/RsmH inhibitor MraZ
MDSQGRLLLPARLREAANVTGDVEVVGAQEFLEVVDRTLFEQESAPLTEAELTALAGFGL